MPPKLEVLLDVLTTFLPVRCRSGELKSERIDVLAAGTRQVWKNV
jgi:hypothetical protein